jgi:outer membrane protein assembly factor BamA
VGQGLQTELPTGSGFYTLQPSLTALFPSDPAVFFGSVSYQYNFKRTGVVQKRSDGPDQEIGEVQAGGVFGFNLGMGLAINDRASFSLGYDHQSVAKPKINGSAPANAVRVQLGQLLVGYSYRLSDKQSVNFSLGAGLTRDTPDLTLSLRVPFTL